MTAAPSIKIRRRPIRSEMGPEIMAKTPTMREYADTRVPRIESEMPSSSPIRGKIGAMIMIWLDELKTSSQRGEDDDEGRAPLVAERRFVLAAAGEAGLRNGQTPRPQSPTSRLVQREAFLGPTGSYRRCAEQKSQWLPRGATDGSTARSTFATEKSSFTLVSIISSPSSPGFLPREGSRSTFAAQALIRNGTTAAGRWFCSWQRRVPALRMGIRTESQQLQHRRTKIVATVGPASSAPTMLEALIKAGVDVFRLNFSHGSHDEHASVAVAIRNAAVRLGVSVAILADLCGPKIRTGRFEGGAVTLEKGRTVVLTVRDVVGNAQLIPSTYAGLADDLRAGSVVLLDDGQLRLLVERVDGTEVVCRVIEGGVLRDRKGINLPNVSISAPSLTPKDREDALFALELGVDLLALSFVRRPDDVDALRDLVASSSPTPWLVSKIEKPEALERIDGILDRSDAIMVARGDLGVELPPEFVPIAQGQLVDLARARGKPVIVATQMLESTVERTRPTRAEVTDVSSAVSSGADAVMLSAETAIGKHPIGSVEMMDRIARTTEGYLWSRGGFGAGRGRGGALEHRTSPWRSTRPCPALPVSSLSGSAGAGDRRLQP